MVQPQTKIFNLQLSEIEKNEIVELIDAAVRAHGANLNLGMCDHLIRKFVDAKEVEQVEGQSNENPEKQEEVAA